MIEGALAQIFSELGKINDPTDSVEKLKPQSSSDPVVRHKSPRFHSQATVNPWDSLNQQPSSSVGSDPLSKEHSDMDAFWHIQQDFSSMKSLVGKVLLPPYLKLHDSRSRIKREDQPVLTVLSKCGRYIETALKLLSEIKEGEEVDLNPTVVTLIANL